VAVPFFLAIVFPAMSQDLRQLWTCHDLDGFVLGFGALMWLKIDPTQELIQKITRYLPKLSSLPETGSHEWRVRLLVEH